MNKEEEQKCNDLVAICRKIKADYDSGKISKDQICDGFDIADQHKTSVLQCVFEPYNGNYEIWFLIEKNHNIKIVSDLKETFLSEPFPNDIAKHSHLKILCMYAYGCITFVKEVDIGYSKEIWDVWKSAFIDIPDFKTVMIEVSDWFIDLSKRNNGYGIELHQRIRKIIEGTN